MPERTLLANAVRVLAMDAVQKANSGHPGAPMGMADMAQALWCDHLQHNPANPDWPNRDRFVLSNGHASMLLYSVLHLTGYDLSMHDIATFRQMGAKTAGHPEYGLCPGVETTTGPLGQGVANAVGMALAERMLAAEFNTPEYAIVDHFTYVFLGDGCMMEGVAQEAASLAGTLGLGKLIALYDDNGVTIDGPTDGWFTEDIPGRFQALAWNVIPNIDGHDAAAVSRAIGQARAQAPVGKPTLICCKTVIGCGAPNMCGQSKTHGAPLGEEEIAAARKKISWSAEPFTVPEEIAAAWNAREAGEAAENAWNQLFAAYASAHPEKAASFTRRIQGGLPGAWEQAKQSLLAKTQEEAKDMATRKASQAAIERLASILPEMAGGSADLTGSNGTRWSGGKDIAPGFFAGNYINYGVREFAMAAIMNGMALHGGFIPYAGTFLVFSDYSRNAIRMAALMGLRVVHVLTHDSIGVGEDGPTHQPVEHAASLRLIPNLAVWRPCDTLETAAAWIAALENADGPTALALTRQGVPYMERNEEAQRNIARGGYVLLDCDGDPEAVIIATGSEVHVAAEAAKELQSRGRKVRVVSMPCLSLFDGQDQTYKDAVLPPAVTARVAVEAGSPDCWWKYVGLQGAVLGMDTFGESAPGKELFSHFGFTPKHVVLAVEQLLPMN